MNQLPPVSAAITDSLRRSSESVRGRITGDRGTRPRDRSPPVDRSVPDLRITNYDRMRRDVSIEITDETGEVVFETERSIPRGGDATALGIFKAAGSYRVSVSLRYGTSTAATHTIIPRQTGLCLDIHPDGIETYCVPR